MANREGFEEESPAYAAFKKREPEPLVERVKISDGGRLVIPAAMRAAMKVEVGDTVTLRLQPDGELQIVSKAAAIAKAQAIVSTFPKYADDGVSWVDELISERRAEAQKDINETMEYLASKAASESAK